MVKQLEEDSYSLFMEDFNTKKDLDKFYQELGYRGKRDYMVKESEREEEEKIKGEKVRLNILL